MDETDVLVPVPVPADSFYVDSEGIKHGRQTLANGAVYDYDLKRIVAGATHGTLIDQSNAAVYAAARKRKTKQRIRAAILAEHNAAHAAGMLSGSNMQPAASAADAIAEAYALLYSQIVLNADQHVRDWIAALRLVGDNAGLTGDEQLPVQQQQLQLNVISTEAAHMLLQLRSAGAPASIVASPVPETVCTFPSSAVS